MSVDLYGETRTFNTKSVDVVRFRVPSDLVYAVAKYRLITMNSVDFFQMAQDDFDNLDIFSKNPQDSR